MDITFETLDRWPFGGNGTGQKRAPFKAAYPRTVDLLKAELTRASARRPAIQSGQKDGVGRALGTYEMLEFPCATFNHWEDNLRAIALTLKAIRETKKYGVGRVNREQHYEGFKHKRVEARTDAGRNGKLTVEAAAAVIAHCAEGGWTPEVLLKSKTEFESAYRAAARNVHPDYGGTTTGMAKVNEARDVLRVHFAGAGASQ